MRNLNAEGGEDQQTKLNNGVLLDGGRAISALESSNLRIKQGLG
jgi:hypothetical protein